MDNQPEGVRGEAVVNPGRVEYAGTVARLPTVFGARVFEARVFEACASNRTS